MSTWISQKLGEVIDINKSSVKKNFPFQEIEYVDISSVGTGILESSLRIEMSKAPSRAKRLVNDGDTILATVRPNRRSFLYIKNPPQNRVVSTGFAVLSPRTIDSRFLYYIISQQEFTDYLSKNAKGAAYPAVDEEIISRADILVPDLPTQNYIASILSAYDDLIENNYKRIKVLEEIAQLLYTEWFVKFKFPGHEKVKMVDNSSEHGRAPEGWDVKRLGDLIHVRKGKNITQDTILPGIVPVVAGGLKPAYFHNVSNTKNPVITISASGANAGFTRLYFDDVWASDCSYIDVGVTPYVYFYYLFLINKKYSVSNLQRGSAQPHVYPKDLMDLKLIYPSEAIITDFTNLVTPLFKLVKSMNQKNQNLSQIRELLIPQLVTGRRELK